jgi:hypothetical protein
MCQRYEQCAGFIRIWTLVLEPHSTLTEHKIINHMLLHSPVCDVELHVFCGLPPFQELFLNVVLSRLKNCDRRFEYTI